MQECREVLGEENYAKVENMRLDLTVAQNPNLVRCECSALIELIPGAVDYKTTDD